MPNTNPEFPKQVCKTQKTVIGISQSIQVQMPKFQRHMIAKTFSYISSEDTNSKIQTNSSQKGQLLSQFSHSDQSRTATVKTA
ncbi:unnamed protein product [Coffea canephora]|uniref:Uncharacterized protein n=1 Tax=Coffea canephora TaxID=49390 RepID=A0A068VCR7_COFCA|nr:unnamed protein product [Coffea canephora]